jgi:DNA-binding FadR family transcriptional regulator
MSHLSNEISQTLEEAILRGDFAPGERLPSEEKLGARFSASRTVIREAIHQLRGRGLVQTLKGSGTRIAQPDLQMFTRAMETFSVLNRGRSYLELIDLRILLEVECARLAAIHATPEMIALMQRALDKMNTSHGDRKRLGEADIAFHLTIAAASRNRLYASILTSLKKRSVEYASFFSEEGTDYREMITIHQGIFEAISKGQPENSARQMETHLIRSRENYLDKTNRSENEN